MDLLVRDTCRLRPGIKGVSESAKVISIAGRFLEHGRIYYFKNGGDEEYYIGSADLMQCNLQSRVEVVAPVEDPNLREDLRLYLEVQLSDQRCAWEMQADGTYIQRKPEEGESRGTHEMLIEMTEMRLVAAAKYKNKKVRRKLVGRFRKRLSS